LLGEVTAGTTSSSCLMRSAVTNPVEIIGDGDFAIIDLTSHDLDTMAEMLEQRGIIGSLNTVFISQAMRLSQCDGLKCLRCLNRHQRGAVGGVIDPTIDHHFDRVIHRYRRDSPRSTAPDCRYYPSEKRLGCKWTGSIVNTDDLGLNWHRCQPGANAGGPRRPTGYHGAAMTRSFLLDCRCGHDHHHAIGNRLGCGNGQIDHPLLAVDPFELLGTTEPRPGSPGHHHRPNHLMRRHIDRG